MSTTDNRLINALSPTLREELISKCTHVPLPLRTSLYKPEVTPQYAYFMTSGVASIVTETVDADTAEVGLIGREGLVGSLHLLGPALVPSDCFIQIEGAGLRLPFKDLQRLFRSSPEFHDRVLEFIQEQALTLERIAGCHRLHDSEERLARWLLMAQDRTQSDVLNLTQDFLAMMLGARRTTVTMIAGAMQRSGLIEYHRGRVIIPNRENLEAAACDCYAVARVLLENLYTKPVAAA
jgi:CRP-like cAMP-binding protein